MSDDIRELLLFMRDVVFIAACAAGVVLGLWALALSVQP